MYQKALRGLMSKYRRRDGEATRLIDMFNYIRNLIQDMIEIEESTRTQPPKAASKPESKTMSPVPVKRTPK
jgi:hypothetical protein